MKNKNLFNYLLKFFSNLKKNYNTIMQNKFLTKFLITEIFIELNF